MGRALNRSQGLGSGYRSPLTTVPLVFWACLSASCVIRSRALQWTGSRRLQFQLLIRTSGIEIVPFFSSTRTNIFPSRARENNHLPS
ncbi:hypothetical protein QR685DRAFT_70741 [Neurospora intermedia]|uniref:Secreted protein n=1 Tax=Neurospora intermedia TaxID=5142 RepID=A0ABR3DU22_NEUIN